MKISKWYHVLVMGGASLIQTGCGGAESQALDMGGTPDPDVETEQTADRMPDAADVDRDTSPKDATRSGDTNSGDAQNTLDAARVPDVRVPDAASADAAELVCSDSADPADPCGCPCCWAVGFLNSDPECNGFCSAGNGGAGCCPE